MSSDVTALIRTYDSARTLPRCLDSLDRQTCAPREVVVVDSGSTDGTLEIAERRGATIVHYPSDEPFHYSRSLNLGMERVTSEHTLIVSSHVSLPDRETVEILRDLLTEDAQRCAASVRGMSSSAKAADTGILQWDLVTQDTFVSEFGGIAISNSCNFIPTALWRRHPFDESIPRCEDQKWLLHFLERGWNAARVMKPEIVYDNPYYNDTKEISDVLTLAQYGINPRLTGWPSIKHRLRLTLSACKRLDLQKAMYNARISVGLLQIRFGLSKSLSSKYF
jgi:glycosyltransferase involved in cell wall biosynthesis